MPNAEKLVSEALFGIEGIKGEPDNYYIHNEQILALVHRAIGETREQCARLAETYKNGQITGKDTWAEGFSFAKRMIAANIRGLPKDL